MKAYSCCNVMNDLRKKNNKFLILICQSELFLKYIESVLYYSLKDQVDHDIMFFTIDVV